MSIEDRIELINQFIEYNNKNIMDLDNQYKKSESMDVQYYLLHKIHGYKSKNEMYMDIIADLLSYIDDKNEVTQEIIQEDPSDIPIKKPEVTKDGRISFKDFIDLFVCLYRLCMSGNNLMFEGKENEEIPSKIHILSQDNQVLADEIKDFNSLYYALKDLSKS